MILEKTIETENCIITLVAREKTLGRPMTHEEETEVFSGIAKSLRRLISKC
ncbi:MAG: hypothetical protein RR942_13880 [Romboutsia sp.]